MSWDTIQVTYLSLVPNFLPIALALQLDWLLAKLPRTLDSGLFLHAVRRCAVVPFHDFKVSLFVNLLQRCECLRLLKIEVKLDMRSAILTALQLPTNVPWTKLAPVLEIL